eukprot:TRINITY_DN3835_c0_g2_i3.p1 TRINITY_DN3835_c0_g2~~TRINITY_DN3835_c0_g2_i3.p1  ORF type:complete len:107 (+),score=6.30 TRINITY_DN3835_c0_g2_i3:39-359(+)
MQDSNPGLPRSHTMRSPITRDLEIGRRPSNRPGVSLDIEQVDKMIDRAALGPVPERRAVTKTEFSAAKTVIEGVNKKGFKNNYCSRTSKLVNEVQTFVRSALRKKE